MSYPLDLDEYSERSLQAELELRASLRSQGLCDYCRQTGDKPACKFPERHKLATVQPRDILPFRK
jgi:hypothetical protein